MTRQEVVNIIDSEGNVKNVWREVSGNATHTEQRALTRINLIDEIMVITGQKRPCNNCQGAMRRATANNSATIIYQWRENGVTHQAI